MEGTAIAFCIWCAGGALFAGLGVYAFFTKRLMGFWANVETFDVTDVKKYNRAVGFLFCTFGVVLVLLGLPLLAGQNSPWILLSVLGTALAAIVMMVIYTTVIEAKYKKYKK
ncbi:MAG: hypothetical protein IJ012_06555 [Clostridia bacterium]|nr:hypothetical protein [Clostridia bacterium]